MPYTLVSIDGLLNEVQSELPGVNSAHLEAVAHSTINRFLERSSTWRYTDTPDVDVNGLAEFSSPSGSVICYYKGIRWAEGVQHARTTFTTTTPYEVTLDPVPESHTVGDLEVLLILKMGQGCKQIPDYIYNTHYEGLLAGVKARLFIEPTKPYTDLGMGTILMKEFQTRISEARDMAERMYGTNESRWRYPRWTM